MQPDAELEVFGQRTFRESADKLEWFATEHDVGAAAEHRRCGVLAAGDGPEEQRLLGPCRLGHAAAFVVGVVLRRLHERHPVVAEVAERFLEERGVGDVVAVEHGHEGGVGDGQGVVDVAGLRPGMLGALHVADAEPAGHAAHRRAVAVVEEGDVHSCAAHAAGGVDRCFDDLDGFVVDGDEHVDVDEVPDRRCHGVASGLAPTGEPETDGLSEVEELGGDEDGEQQPGCRPVRVATAT